VRGTPKWPLACPVSTAFVSSRGVDAGKGSRAGIPSVTLDEEEPMAVAFIREFAISDRGTANYDAVNERLTKNQPAPEVLLIHFAGFDAEDRVLRLVNVGRRGNRARRTLTSP
jgi:hypothetical protein